MPELNFAGILDRIISHMPPTAAAPPVAPSPVPPRPSPPGAFDVLRANALPRVPPLPVAVAALNPGATALADQPLTAMPAMTRLPQMVKAAPIGPAFTPGNPSLGQLAGILFNETRGQSPGPGAPGMDALRGAMGNAVMNGYEQGVNKPGYTVGPAIDGPVMGKILGGILNPQADQHDTNAFNSSFRAALGALNRSAPPAAGPGSGTFFNGRSDARTTPNTVNPNMPLPFAGTMAPYNNGEFPYWAFFQNPKLRP